MAWPTFVKLLPTVRYIATEVAPFPPCPPPGIAASDEIIERQMGGYTGE